MKQKLCSLTETMAPILGFPHVSLRLFDIWKYRGKARISMFSRREFTPVSKVSRQTGDKDDAKKVERRGGKVDSSTNSTTR
jgi:hypothetical protein